MYASFVSGIISGLNSAGENSPAPVPAELFQCEELTVEMHPIAEHFYRANGYKFRIGRYERMFVVRSRQQIIAAARMLPRQQGAYWLRNMLVAKEKRNTGVGRFLMEGIMGFIVPGSCYCFALPQVVDFYQRLGFLIGISDQCPLDIAAEYRKYKSRGRDWVLMYAKSSSYQQDD